jgi:DNA-binding NtrC family response regulator
MESSDRLGVASLPSYIQTVSPLEPTNASGAAATGRAGAESRVDNFSDLNYPILKERFEKEFIQRALQAFNGRINQTAEHTQMTKVTLLRKLEKYGINPRDFKQD